MRKFVFSVLILFAVLTLCAQNPKYVFLFIGDGMSTPQRMIADEFSRKLGKGQLAINTLPFHATTRTCSANSLVTDSAAAATAIACGERTNNGRVGMSADGSRKLVSMAEVARDKGKKVGIVTSVTINHATPAGFYAHRKSRAEMYAIGLDLIASNFDYFGGGGAAKHDDKKSPLYKGDIYDLAAKAGYKVIGTRQELLNLKPGAGKVLAYGVKSANLPFAIDRKDQSVATLAEFTAKGIELLQDAPKGFFMMVEGGAIDWCGHANDAASNLREVLAFDEAVKVALKFAEKHPDETLIVVTGDHETGGMTMGFAGTGYALYVERLVHQTCSAASFITRLKELKKANPKLRFEDIKKLLSESFGFKFEVKTPEILAYEKNPKKHPMKDRDPMILTAAEVSQLEEAFKEKKPAAFALEAKNVLSHKAGIGWTSGAHTALPVLTTSKGVKAKLFTGFINNTDIAIKMKSILQ
ncbi:MAG: alkaline phosphatase [Lentisphaeria bacterium]|nr:alkaline phosphatase [Lentisphaeria bacterium]